MEHASTVGSHCSDVESAIRRSNEEAGWEEVYARFLKLAAPDGMVSCSNFGPCIGMDDREFAENILQVLARRRGRQQCIAMNKEELKEYWVDINDKRFSARMQLFFDLCDKGLDGRISETDIKEAIMFSASANKMPILEQQADECAALIMDTLDDGQTGHIEVSQFETLLADPALAHEFSPVPSSNISGSFSLNIKSIIADDWRRMWLYGAWLSIVGILFTWKFILYSYRSSFELMGYCLCTAKGAAETLKFNMAIILLPVCRNMMTWLRRTCLNVIFPFDDCVEFHKTVATAISLGVILHAVAHLSCDFPRIANARHDKFMQTIGNHFHGVQPSYLQILRTIEGGTGLAMVLLMALAFVFATHWWRKGKLNFCWPFNGLTGFNAFWYSHHLFVIVYGLLIVHSMFLFLTQNWLEKTTWMYITIPFLLYLGERMLRLIRACTYDVKIVKVEKHCGNVLALEFTKPCRFSYHSGMYLFLQCPSISPFEWHPFSITSAPGDENLMIHVRASGDWTQELIKAFTEAIEDPTKKDLEQDVIRYPKLLIDGPYGAAAQDFSKYDILLLIGLGIGATPFISILKDMVNRTSLFKHSTICATTPSTGLNKHQVRFPTNAYFYWVTREQGSFDWFKGVMNEIAEADQKAIIEMHNYLTSVHEEGDIRSILISLIQALYHAKSGVDIVSGTKVRTHFARPNWNKVFSKLAENHPQSKIGVFYCGPPSLYKELSALCWRYTDQTKTRFIFHKGSFK